MWPPATGAFSTSRTSTPSLCSRYAAVSPAMPAPMTRTSAMVRNLFVCSYRRRVLLVRPLAGFQEHVVEPRLGRAGLGVPVGPPLHERRHRHQDRLGAAAGLEAEVRAAILDEVELDVAAAT